MIPTGGTTVRYQGVVCLPDFEFALEASLRPTSGYVRMSLADLGIQSVDQLRIDPGATGLDTQHLRSREAGDEPVGDGPAGGAGVLYSLGDLEIIEAATDGGIGEPATYSVTFRNVYVDESAMRADFPTDNQSETVTVRIASYQYLWSRRGTFTGWFNVPLLAPSRPKRARTVTADESGELDPDDFAPGSLRNGTLWTLRQIIEERVLPALPTAPRLWAIDAAAGGSTPINYQYLAANPAHVLGRLLAEADLIPGPRPDGALEIHARDAGPPRKQDGRSIAIELLAHAEPNVSHHYVPLVVEVVGPPILQEVRVALEPVGESGGNIMPLSDALEAWGLPRLEVGPPVPDSKPPQRMPESGRLLMQPRAQRAEVSPEITEEAAKELDRWAFRWWRIVGTAAERAALLPMFPVPWLDGQRPVRAFAETYELVNAASLAGNVAAAQRLTSVVDAARSVQRTVDQGQGTLTARDDAEQQLLLRARAQAAIDRAHAFVAALRASPVVLINIPFRECSSGFQVRRESGVIEFDRIIGHIYPDGSTVAHFARLVSPTRAEAIFACERKPKPDSPLTLSHHYASWWAREENGALVRLARCPDGVTPTVLVNDSLRQIDYIDGTSNREQLDAIARRDAGALLGRPKMTRAAKLSYTRPLDIAPTGLVRSVTWAGPAGNGRYATTAHVGAYDPRLGAPRLRSVVDEMAPAASPVVAPKPRRVR